MTIEETAEIMDILSVTYPQFYGGRNAPDPEKGLMLWAALFQDESLALVAAAVKALIVSEPGGFPPSPGAVKGKIMQITTPEKMTESEAWAIAAQAVRRTDWHHPERQFDKLPPDIQSAVGSPQTLVEWGKAEENAFTTVIASNFQRAYRARRKSTRENAALPGDVKAFVARFGDKLSLEGSE